MGFLSYWKLNTLHLASNIIKWMDYSFLNLICSIKVLPYINLSHCITMSSRSVIVEVVASVSISDRQIWHSTHLFGVFFATSSALSFAVVLVCATFLANVLLGPVALVQTFCNSCCSWYWNYLLISLFLPGVTKWILCSNYTVAFGLSASDQVVATCPARFRRTLNCIHIVVVTVSAPDTWSSIAAWILRIFCPHNWWDSLANCSSSWAFADFDIVCSHIVPFVQYIGMSASSSTLRDW